MTSASTIPQQSDDLACDGVADLARFRRRSLVSACMAHVLHDGYTDLLYLLLPVWQAEFGLGYAALGVIRAAYYGAMAIAQIPVDRLTAPLGSRLSLVGGTFVAAMGFILAGASHGLTLLCAALLISGLGSSTQHPRSSVIITEAYAGHARGALGIYNFSGDLGKALLPGLTALLLIAMPWRTAAFVLAGIGSLVALGLAVLVPINRHGPVRPIKGATDYRAGFAILFAIGALDTATRMGFLLFFPFVLIAKHASETTVGAGLTLVFVGGAFGKFACGWLGQRFGLVGTVIATEAMTTVMIATVPSLPLAAVLALLPLLGIALNGTSSVLYGTVPEVTKGDLGPAFALFYTGVIGSGALAPVLFGVLADHFGRSASLMIAAATASAAIPLVVLLGHLLTGNKQARAGKRSQA